jgi:multidrug efflux system membrane fusion protein
MRTVTPGAVNAGTTAVDGIQPGDVVVNSSFEKLQPNAKVSVAKASQPATTNGSSTP